MPSKSADHWPSGRTAREQLGSDDSDDLPALHVASHTVFFVPLTLHLGLVLKHTVVRRNRLLSRMT